MDGDRCTAASLLGDPWCDDERHCVGELVPPGPDDDDDDIPHADACGYHAALWTLRGTLARLLREDPSTAAHDPDDPEVTAAYRRRDVLVWRALASASAAGLPAGVGTDTDDEHRPLVAYLELPDAGQVSWHLPGHQHQWDGHDHATRDARVRQWLELPDPHHGSGAVL